MAKIDVDVEFEAECRVFPYCKKVVDGLVPACDICQYLIIRNQVKEKCSDSEYDKI